MTFLTKINYKHQKKFFFKLQSSTNFIFIILCKTTEFQKKLIKLTILNQIVQKHLKRFVSLCRYEIFGLY